MLSWLKRFITPPRPTLFVLTGVLLVILAAKGELIRSFGSDLPYMDQWDAEAQMLLIPSVEGNLGAENFIAPHNEHRIVLTKLLNFELTKLNGQWSPLLEMTFGALIHVCAIGTLLAFAQRHLSAPVFSFVASFAALLFALSYAWENTLQGFQSQFYFLMWSALASIWLMLGAVTLGKRWWLGFAVLIVGLGSMSSGFVAGIAIGALLVLRAGVERRWERRNSVMLLALVLICLVGVLLTRHVPGHDVLRAASLSQLFSSFFSCLAWPLVQPQVWALLIQIPAVILALTCLRRRELRSADAVILGFSLWCWLQLAALSYARGHTSPTLSPRYSDMMAIGLLVNAIALGRVWLGWIDRLRPLVAIAWILAVVPALLDLGASSSAYLAASYSESRAREASLLKAFIRTQDEAILRSAPVENLPHPSADTIIRVLRHPGLQTLLPPALQLKPSQVKQGILSRANHAYLERIEALKYTGMCLILLGFFGIGWGKREELAALVRTIGTVFSRCVSSLLALLAHCVAWIIRTWPALGKLLPPSDASASADGTPPLANKSRGVTLLTFAAIVLLILGAKFGLIHRFGSDLPFMDTWDAQADRILIPHAEGRLALHDFWAPHNEHHVLWTRLLNFGLAMANKQWDPKLECAANAFIITALAGALLLFARRQLRGLPFLLVASVMGLLFALPFGYENTLYGFQSQFYFLSLSAFGTLWLCAGARPFSFRWCAGVVMALTGLASMASGFLAPVALLSVMALRLLLERRLTLRTSLGAGVIGLVAGLGILWINPVPLHAELHAQSLSQFVGTFLAEASWPSSSSMPLAVLMQLPIALLFTRVWRERNLKSWDAVVLGLAAWSWFQFAAIAYARGGASIQECPRYEDLFILGVMANTLALARLLEGGSKRGWMVVLAGASLLCLVIGSAPQWEKFSRGILPETAVQRASSARKLRPYLRTHDAVEYSKIADEDLPYPNRIRLKEFLDNPGLQPLWPVSLRPATILRPATDSHGFVRTTKPLAEDQPNEPVWSADEGPARFVSAPLPEHLLPVLQFRFRGSPELSAGVISILSADGALHRLKASPLAGHRWQSAHLELPDGPRPLRIVVEVPSGRHSFAFADPIEVGKLSWINKYVLGFHSMLTWTGLLLGAVSLVILVRSEPPTGGYLRAIGRWLSWCAGLDQNSF